MKKLIISIFALTLGGCMNMNSDQPKLNINYPAAYVVNGESSTVSIINLNTNEVANLIQLTDGSGTQMQGMNMGKTLAFPHHIYLNASKTQIAIAAPGMDLSAGHSGGMAGMKGKIGQSLSFALPIVSTKIGIEGINLQENWNESLRISKGNFLRQLENFEHE